MLMIGEIRDAAMRGYIGSLYFLFSFSVNLKLLPKIVYKLKKKKKGQNGKTFLPPTSFY